LNFYFKYSLGKTSLGFKNTGISDLSKPFNKGFSIGFPFSKS